MRRKPREVSDRIIPARAGFTTHARVRPVAVEDHPRSRGVYSDRHPRMRGVGGSSPLARGLPGEHLPVLLHGRIIPARAGFTSTQPTHSHSPADHPRSRGVYAYDKGAMDVRQGSSPLARGLPHRPSHPYPGKRIIPARAGFTASARPYGHGSRDHPRSRGVYTGWSCGCHTPQGSSPLARGLRSSQARSPWRSRIIPARAGFTPLAQPGDAERGDHPRSRGVYSVKGIAAKPINGSSPLARGLQQVRQVRRLIAGIIPARAGFTW